MRHTVKVGSGALTVTQIVNAEFEESLLYSTPLISKNCSLWKIFKIFELTQRIMSSISPSVGAGSSAQQIGRGAASSSRARGGAHGKQLNSRWNSGRKPEQKLPLTHCMF